MNHAAGETHDLEDIVGRMADEFSQRLRDGQDPQIEDYVEQYPAAADIIRQVLSSLTLLQQDGPEDDEQPDARPFKSDAACGILGDYRLIREVGRGGMGIVYEAEQLSLARRVALKILPFAAVLDERQIRRFHNEARAAAQLKHPNIVQVFGVGCQRGVHYYAMEFVDGVSLAEAIAALTNVQNADSPREVDLATSACLTKAIGGPQHHIETADIAEETASTDRFATLSSHRHPEFFRHAARIGMQVARALDHAHAEGVIHRDIKPSNLMIDAEAKVSVTDFGLARIETDGGMTMTGDLVGTLRYMSPEQALAQRNVVDHRTDIYSLGVTLYELATQRPVFIQEGRHELLRAISFQEPVRPKKLNPSIPADLETIVLKAIEKNPNDRYLTAEEMADDLERFLNDELIHAHRPTAAEFAFRWVKKRRRAVAFMVGALLLAALTGVAALAYNQSRLSAAAEQLRIERDYATEAQSKAEAEAAKATAISDLLQNALRSANTVQAKGSDFTVRELLDEISDNLDNELVDQPEARAALHAVIGNAYLSLEELDKAGEHLQTALDMRTTLFGDKHSDVVDSIIALSRYFWETGDRDASESLARKAIAINREFALDKEQLVRGLYALGQNLWPRAGTYEELEQVVAEVRAIGIEQNAEYRQLASMTHWMAVRLREDGNSEKAEALGREAVELHRRLDGPYHPETAWGLGELGIVLYGQENFGEAASCFEEAVAIFRRLYDDTRTPVLRLLYWRTAAAQEAGDTDALQNVQRQVEPLVEVERSDALSWYWEARIHVKLRQLDHMATCFAKVMRLDGPMLFTPSDRYAAGLAFVATDDEASYQELCGELVRSMVEDDDWSSACLAAWVCALSSASTKNDSATAVERMHSLALSHPGNPDGDFFIGALRYRLGDYEAAAKQLRSAIDLYPTGDDWFSAPLHAKLFLVMTELRLGHVTAAQEMLAESESELSQAHQSRPWNDCVELKLFQKEIEELLATEPKVDKEEDASNTLSAGGRQVSCARAIASDAWTGFSYAILAAVSFPRTS